MLKLSLLISLLFSGGLLANSKINQLLEKKQSQKVYKLSNTPIHFSCSTELPTTSIIVETFDDKVIFRMIHHNGLKFAPIHSGVITQSDIPFIEKKGALFSKMGEQVVLEFDLERCKKHQEGNYSCYNSNPTTIGELAVKSYGLQTYQSTSELYGMSFKNLSFRFNVTVGNRSLSSNMEYDLPNDCLFK
jgi:hypothetical protein